VLLILLAVYTATFTGLPDVPDAEVEFQTASALVRTGGLAVGGTPEARAIAATGFGVAAGGEGREDLLYSRYGIGQAFAGVPLYAVGRVLGLVWPEIELRHAASEAYGFPRSEYFAHLVVGWRNPLLGALTGMLVVLAALRLGASRNSAWICGLGYGLCTFAWPQARSTLSDVQATFLLFGAFVLLVHAREDRARRVSVSPWSLAAAGTALGGALLTRIAVLPAVIGLAGIGWMVLGSGASFASGPEERGSNRAGSASRRNALALLLPIALCAGSLLAVNSLRFGHPLRTGYESAIDAVGFFTTHPLRGLGGLLISPGRGLIWMAPGLLLVPLALRGAARSSEKLWLWTLAAMAAATLLPAAFLRGWHGAWTYGPRYVLPLLPFAWLGVAFALDAVRDRRWMQWLAVALLALGSAVQLGGALVDHTTHTDLGLQAARAEWPDWPGVPEREQEELRFERLQWDWRFAAPWAHWRILRHRLSGLGDIYSARELYSTRMDAPIVPSHERERGFRHLAWVDLSQRLHGPSWPGPALCALLGGLGLALAYRAREPAAAGSSRPS
jgi:hypothetical protein